MLHAASERRLGRGRSSTSERNSGKREGEGDEFTGHRAPVVVAPDYGIQANLGEEEESGRRSRMRRNRKLSWW